MAILDIFNSKKGEKEEKAGAEPAVVKARKPKEKKEAPATPRKESAFADAYRIFQSPVITEKAAYLAEKNQYAFKVFPRSNKAEIRKAVEKLYGVIVTRVNIINIPRQTRIVGRKRGFEPGYKKAIVTVKAGQKIEVVAR